MKPFNLFLCVLALCVIGLGAYTRLKDAGLGCPDWPGCYGQLIVPQTASDIASAEAKFAQTVEPHKAWIEMIHRYLAGTLGIGILILAMLCFKHRHKYEKLPLIPFVLIGVLVFQALLGMWTVTLKLLPPIILLHLFGGLTILSLLWWQFLEKPRSYISNPPPKLLSLTMVGIIILIGQIALGGLTSANYAGLICPDFPYCQGQLLPPMDMSVLFSGDGIAMDNASLITIHMAHRIGALITTLFLLSLSLWVIFSVNTRPWQGYGVAILLLLITQVSLGVLNVMWLLPISLATAHNIVAALLLLALLSLASASRKPTTLFHAKITQ